MSCDGIGIEDVLLTKLNTDVDHGYTILHVAALSGVIAAVKFLVNDKKAKVDSRSANGHTPLINAIFAANLNGTIDTARFLLEKGADPNAENYDHWTSLSLNEVGTHDPGVKSQLTELLLKHKADKAFANSGKRAEARLASYLMNIINGARTLKSFVQKAALKLVIVTFL